MNTLVPTGLDLFLSWLNKERDSNYRLAGSHGTSALASDNTSRINIAVRPLFDDSDQDWTRTCEDIASKLLTAGSGPVVLWLPPDTEPPGEDQTAWILRVVQAAAPLAPGQRSQVTFPVDLTLKKVSNDGSYVRVVGGLAQHWAKLTGRIFGTYDLDIRAIHRLPEPESRLSELLDWVVLLGNGLKPGALSTFTGEDAWTITRPASADFTAVIGALPGSDPSNGTAVRKWLRLALNNASTELARDPEAAKALVLFGSYRSMDEENASIALRSCDPALYTGFDAICLVADGLCKPLYDPRRG